MQVVSPLVKYSDLVSTTRVTLQLVNVMQHTLNKHSEIKKNFFIALHDFSVLLCEDVALQRFVLALRFESGFVRVDLLGGECLYGSTSSSEFGTLCSLRRAWFAGVRVADFAGVVGTVAVSEVGVRVHAHFTFEGFQQIHWYEFCH